MRYYAGVFNGEGRSVQNANDEQMYMGRLQWNFLGRNLGFSQSDVGYRDKPAGSLAVAGATWRGPYTAFSSVDT